MLVLIVLMLPFILILAAFAINLSYIELARTDMQVATDAAARAAGRELSLTGDQAKAIVAGKDAASRNKVVNNPLVLQDSDFVFGESTRSSITNRYVFDPAGASPNAVRVIGNRTAGSADGAIPMLFLNVLSRDNFEVTQSSISTRVEVDIALVVDRSGSMAYAANEPTNWPNTPAAAPDGWWFCDAAPPQSRWRDLVAAVDAFLAELNSSPQQEKVSLSSYSTWASTDLSLTHDYTQVQSAMAKYSTNFCGGTTNIGGGISSGYSALTDPSHERSWTSKVMVVMTDGNHNVGLDPVAAAHTASAGGVTVFTVTFSEEAAKDTMMDVANAGFGKHFHATTSADLVAVFQEIARLLPTLLTR